MTKSNIKTKINKVTISALATIMLVSSLSPLTVLASSNVNTEGKEMRMGGAEIEVSIEDKIPDENLKQAIREKLGVSIITDKNILNLTELSVLNKNIRDITGINYAKNLEKLMLIGNRLTNIDPQVFKGLTKLKDLGISFNQLKKLDPQIFNGLTNL